MLNSSHYQEQRSSIDIQANQSMEEMLQNSTAGFSDVLEKVRPSAVFLSDPCPIIVYACQQLTDSKTC